MSTIRLYDGAARKAGHFIHHVTNGSQATHGKRIVAKMREIDLRGSAAASRA